MKFKLHTPNNQIFNQDTLFNGKKITDKVTLCKTIKIIFCTNQKCRSFTDWANQLNATGEYEGTFTKHDALDSLCSNYNLNINNKYVDLHQFFKQFLPFKS